MSRIVFLGPQRFDPIVRDVLASLGVTGKIATITAGWQEREAEDAELHEHLGERTVNLRLYEFAEDIFESDPEFAEGHRERQQRLHEIQTLYRIRLQHAMEAAAELMRRMGEPAVIEPERENAIEAIRVLDAQHAKRIRGVQAAFISKWHPSERASVRKRRRNVIASMRDTDAICIAGGHVAVLLNRLRLFDLPGLAGDRPIVAWSAGAMSLADRVILFHDDPPEGPGRAELLDLGLGMVPDIVPLPHATKRLRIHDRACMSRLARRFAPAGCVPLDAGARVDWDGEQWTTRGTTPMVRSDGRLSTAEAA